MKRMLIIVAAIVIVLFGLAVLLTHKSPQSNTSHNQGIINSTKTTKSPNNSSVPSSTNIPQNNGGDHDGDNNGGPDDGDGSL